MFNTAVLDVAIGMAFVYLLLSLLCSAVAEVIAGVFNLRARNLEAGIRSLFSNGFGPGGNAFVRQIYEHGLIRGLYRDKAVDLLPTPGAELTSHYTPPDGESGRKLPSYIPSRTFALALIDILASAPTPALPANAAGGTGGAGPPLAPAIPEPLASIQRTILALPDSKAKQALQSLTISSGNELAKLQSNLENWYNDAADRAAGWYKRQNQWILLGLGLILAILVNANSLTLARVLWVDPGIREATVKSADSYLETHPAIKTTMAPAGSAAADTSLNQACGAVTANAKDPVNVNKCPDQTKQDLELLGGRIDALSEAESRMLLPIGWKKSLWEGPFWTPFNDGEHLQRLAISLLGWILTAIALSLGAPFWFDLLNKFMVVRSTVKPQEKSRIEKSKD